MEVIPMLGERLKELRKQKKLTAKQCGEKFNLAESTISGYETGNRKPDFVTLEKFADFFGVTTDYLLGRTDDPNMIIVADKKIQLTSEEFQVIREIMKHGEAFNALLSDPERKVKEMIKSWDLLRKHIKDIEDDDKEYLDE